MRYRQMTADGDYQFAGSTKFLINTPDAVRQAVETRLRLYAGEWFLDLREGLDRSRIEGYGTQATRDPEVRARILGTPGVRSLLSYFSSVDERRGFAVSARIDTIYGPADINEVL